LIASGLPTSQRSSGGGAGRHAGLFKSMKVPLLGPALWAKEEASLCY
jgi:hypothetical protein